VAQAADIVIEAERSLARPLHGWSAKPEPGSACLVCASAARVSHIGPVGQPASPPAYA